MARFSSAPTVAPKCSNLPITEPGRTRPELARVANRDWPEFHPHLLPQRLRAAAGLAARRRRCGRG